MADDRLTIEGELLKAIAVAWHDLGAPGPVGRSIAASVTHEYLGEVMAWAVAAIGARETRLRHAEAAEAAWDGWFQPDPEDAEESALRAYLRGD